MASVNYNEGVYKALTGGVDFDTDSFKAMIVSSAYTPDVDAHHNRDDVTNEVSGTGYTAGGEAITCTVTKDDANNRIDIAWDDVTWEGATITGRGVVIYKDTGNAATDTLISYVDWGENKSSVGADFVATFTAPLRFQL